MKPLNLHYEIYNIAAETHSSSCFNLLTMLAELPDVASQPFNSALSSKKPKHADLTKPKPKPKPDHVAWQYLSDYAKFIIKAIAINSVASLPCVVLAYSPSSFRDLQDSDDPCSPRLRKQCSLSGGDKSYVGSKYRSTSRAHGDALLLQSPQQSGGSYSRRL